MFMKSHVRRFEAATGTTPLPWVPHQRMAASQRMLETTTATVDEIAATIGSAGVREDG